MNIYVGNLSYNASESELRDAFAAYGEVVRASIVMDRETNRSRGFAFVEMADAQEGRNAISALNGTPLGGRNISCNEARERQPRSGGGGGGGGGYNKRRF